MICCHLIAITIAQVAPPVTPHTDTTTPERRAHHALVYDEAGRRVLLTGGSSPRDGGSRFVFFDDLWSFDGTRWRTLAPSGTKSSGRRLAYRPDRREIVSFGGYVDDHAIGEVRALERDAWKSLGAHPSLVAAEPGFVFDRARSRFILFGGSSAPGRMNGETWSFDGTAWTRVEGAGPPARAAHVMEYDERRRRLVVFGGMGVTERGQRPNALGDLWEFDGARWIEVKPVDPTPGPRISAGSTYDSKRGLVIVFGGSASGFLGDTWGWDGRAWRRLAADGPSPRAMGQLAYDRVRDRVVLFGGRSGWPDGDLGDTWEWDGERWRRVGS